MTRQEAIEATGARWKRLNLIPEKHPVVFSADVDNAMGCTCIRLWFSEDSPHHYTCPCYVPKANPELNQILNAELNEQFRNGTLDYEEYDT